MSKKIHSPDSNYKLYTLFPVPVHVIDVGNFDSIRNKLIQHVYDERKRDPKGVVISNRGGWQSRSFDINKPNILLHSTIAKAVSRISYFKQGTTVRIHGWMNINKKGDYNRSHNHPGSDMSGILYLKCNKKSGRVVFDSPYTFSSWNELSSYNDEFVENTNCYKSYRFYPIEGRMLVFPAHFRHLVEENESDEDRISIAFNLNLNE